MSKNNKTKKQTNKKKHCLSLWSLLDRTTTQNDIEERDLFSCHLTVSCLVRKWCNSMLNIKYILIPFDCATFSLSVWTDTFRFDGNLSRPHHGWWWRRPVLLFFFFSIIPHLLLSFLYPLGAAVELFISEATANRLVIRDRSPVEQTLQ